MTVGASKWSSRASSGGARTKTVTIYQHFELQLSPLDNCTFVFLMQWRQAAYCLINWSQVIHFWSTPQTHPHVLRTLYDYETRKAIQNLLLSNALAANCQRSGLYNPQVHRLSGTGHNRAETLMLSPKSSIDFPSGVMSICYRTYFTKLWM